jgi:N-acyl-D-amino-acid deacylase
MQTERHCDILITGGTVYDGSGAPGVAADLAIDGNTITAVGTLSDWSARETIDASGKAVAPGFIDAHTHDDLALIEEPELRNKVCQGVTTVVAGNCGLSPAPLGPRQEDVAPFTIFRKPGGVETTPRYPTFGAYLDDLKKAQPWVHVVSLVGHLTCRAAVMDDLFRPANGDEISAMQALVEEAMTSGADGLSTGLAYPPGLQAPTDEVVALAEVTARHGGIYCTHMRDESLGLLDSIDESLDIGRRAKISVVISHHKCSGKAAWGLSKQSLARIDEGAKAQEVHFDLYPYTASSTGLMADWVSDAERVMITGSEPMPEAAGRDLAELAAEWGCDVSEAVARLHPARAIYFKMDEADLERILAHPLCMIGSDGLPGDSHPHPRLWGTFPRILGRYVRERGVIDLTTAIHKMTGLTAKVFGLEGRGILAPGNQADVVVFDPATVIDRADYENPVSLPAGIERVIIGGEVRVEN